MSNSTEEQIIALLDKHYLVDRMRDDVLLIAQEADQIAALLKQLVEYIDHGHGDSTALDTAREMVGGF